MSEQIEIPQETIAADTIRAHRKRECALGYRLFSALKWGDLGDGHISARDPVHTDSFWMLPYGAAYQSATESDLILVSDKGATIEGEGAVNMAGYYIHHPILAARPDLVSAVHVHTGWGTPFSSEVRPIEPISQEACIFFEDHALFDDDEVQIQSVDAGRRIADKLAQFRAIILRNHGLLTAADSVAEAVGSFVLMERVAEVHMKVTNPKPISASAARFAKQDLVKNGAGRIAFASLLKRHIKDAMPN